MLSRSLLLHKLNAMAVSLCVFAFFSGSLWLATWFYLFPDYLFWLDGGFQGLRLVLVVDLILGPLMAFIIYNPAKPRRELLMDVALLGAIQLSAMVWGYYQVWSTRPVAVVYGDNRFVAVTAADIELQSKTAADLRVYSAQRLPLIYRREPQSLEEGARLVSMMLSRSIAPEAQVWLYEKFEPNRHHVFARSEDVLRHVEKNMNKEWQGWLADQDKPSGADYQLAFFQGRYGDAVVIFAGGGDYVGYLPMPGQVPAFKPASPASQVP